MISARIGSLAGGRIALALAAATAALRPAPARADHLELTSGQVIEAIITGEDDKFVTIEDGSSRNRIPRTRIKSIRKTTEADHQIIRARAQMAEGKMSEAIMQMAAALRDGAEPESAAGILLQNRAAVNAALPTLKTDAREDFQSVLSAIAGVKERGPDLAVARVLWMLSLADETGARGALADLRERNPEALEAARGDLSAALAAAADRALSLNKFSAALDLLVEMREVDREEAGSRRVELILLWARRERDAGHFESAIEIYEQQLMPDSPNIARDRILVALGEAEATYRANGEHGRAIELYEKHGMALDPEGTPKRLRQLWLELGWQLMRDNRITQAREAFGRCELIEPGSAKAALAFCDYAETRNGLEPEDRVGHFKLGEWALGVGLLEQAREAFLVAGESPALAESVHDRLGRIVNIETEQELEKLLNLYEIGEYTDTLQGLTALRQRPIGAGYKKQIDQLESLAREGLAVAHAERPQQAEALMQQAERAYWTGKHEEAFDLLQALTSRFADTPAARRGEQFFRLIRNRLDLNQIEGRRKLGRAPAGLGAEIKSIHEETPDPKNAALAEEIRKLRADPQPAPAGTPGDASPAPDSTLGTDTEKRNLE